MKLNSHYKFESTFSLNEIITSEKIHAIISDAATQIAELQDKKRVEILECSFKGKVSFRVLDTECFYPISWDVQLKMDDVYKFISETHPGLSSDILQQIFEEDMWEWSEYYLNQVDFETLEYL